MKSLTVVDNGKDREKWFKARRNYITATMVSAIVGSSEYSKILDVWEERMNPDYLAPDRNEFLDARARHGQDREEAIIAWASEREEIGGKLTPNRALVIQPEGYESQYPYAEGYACTPDAYRYRRGQSRPRIVDAKSTQQNWHTEGGVGKPIGLPQHIIDQMLVTYVVTDAEIVQLAVEQWTWKGTTPVEVVDRYIIDVPWDQNRWEYLDRMVQWYRRLEAEGIAPVSELSLVEPEPIEFDDPPAIAAEKAAAWEAYETDDLAAARAELEEFALLKARTDADVKRMSVLTDKLKARIKAYDGRGVTFTDEYATVTLRRNTKTNRSWADVPESIRRQITTYEESETVTITVSPDWLLDHTEGNHA